MQSMSQSCERGGEEYMDFLSGGVRIMEGREDGEGEEKAKDWGKEEDGEEV